jgi:lysophospholipase L1-like esterase
MNTMVRLLVTNAVRVSFAVLIVLTAGVLPGTSLSAEEFFFRPNDRIVFLGDSITEQYQYSTYIELYLTTRFPEWNLTFLNAGISGDTATGGAGRFASHVLAEQPTCVTINFGMNDAGYGAFDPNRHRPYVENTTKMLAAAQAAGVRVALMSPNAVDRRIQDRFKLYLETQQEFYAPLAELASQQGAAFADQYAITRQALERMEADGASQVIPYYDGFHTSPPGGLLMAHAILTSLKAPALVSEVEINVATGEQRTQGCTIDAVRRAPNGVGFTRLDEALPMPVQADWVSLLPYVQNLDDLNAYRLKVSGLAEGRYAVDIDDQRVSEATHEELSAGLNLGNATQGPVYQQAQAVFEQINAKNQLVHQRFRGVVMFQAPDWLADVANERKPLELSKRKAAIDAAQAKIYTAAKPVPRRFKVVKLP